MKIPIKYDPEKLAKNTDLVRVRDAIKGARQHKRGFWKDKTPLLHAYEFRWIIDALGGRRDGPDRYCGNFTTGKLYKLQQYYLAPGESRLWFYGGDLGSALNMGFELV